MKLIGYACIKLYLSNLYTYILEISSGYINVFPGLSLYDCIRFAKTGPHCILKQLQQSWLSVIHWVTVT